MSKKIWLYSKGKISESGYTREDLKKLIEENQFSTGTLCSSAGAKRWLPLFFYLNDLSALATPLAYPLKIFIEEKDPRIRLWAMIDFCEMLCRILTFTFLAERETNKSIDQKTRTQLARLIDQPSFASWLNCALKLVETHQPPPALQRPKYFLYHQLSNFLQGEQKKKRTDETSLIELRNRMAHFGPMPKIEADRMLSIWEEKFEDIITHTEWLVSFTLLGKTKDDQWSMIHSPEGKTTPFLNPNMPKEEEPDAVWLKIEDLTLRLWPMAAFGRPSLEEDSGDRTIEQEYSQIYVRREQVRLGYFPVGAQGIGKSDSSLNAREAYDRIFPTRSLSKSKDFQVNGLEGEILQEARKMVGRAEQLEQILAMIRERKNGVLWIDGLPGMGKSALMAKVYMELIENLPVPNQTVLPYRFRANDQDRCNRKSFAQFLIERLVDAEALRDVFEDQPKEKAEKRLKSALGLLKDDQTLVLLLDGLDEIANSDQGFAEEIPLALRFSNVLWVCSGRPEPTIEEPMHRLGGEQVFPEGLPPMNENDVRAMFMEKLGPLQRKKLIVNERDGEDGAESPFVHLVTERAGGLPLYVVYAIGDVLNGTYRVLDGEENLPPSLDAYHAKLIERLGIGALAEILTPLAAGLAVAREPLSEREIFQLLLFMNRMEKDEEELVDRALLALSGMLTTAPDPEGEVGYRLFHQSLREHILGNPEMTSPVKRARRAFADLAEREEQPDCLRNYLLRCGIDHLLETDRKEGAERLLLDLDHLYAMNRQKIEETTLYRYWEELGGESRSMQYRESVDKTLKDLNDKDSFAKADLAQSLADVARWKNLRAQLAEKILESKLAKLGQDHPDVAISYNNLGEAYLSKGEFDRGIEYHEKSLKIQLAKLGQDHPDVARSYNHLGFAYLTRGEFDRGIEYLEKSLEIMLAKLGQDHPDVAVTYSHLGIAHLDKGENDRAFEYLEKALKIRLEKLGQDHLDVAKSYNSLGSAYLTRGEFDRGIEYLEKSLEIMLAKLGQGHPSVVRQYGILGSAYLSKGELDRGIEYLEKSLEIMLAKLGQDYPAVAVTYNDLGSAYLSKGEFDRGIEYKEKSLEIQLTKHGQDHFVAISYNNLGLSYTKAGKFEEALKYLSKAVEIVTDEKGNFSLENSSVIGNYGHALGMSGKVEEGVAFLTLALKRKLEEETPTFPSIQKFYQKLTEIFEFAGEEHKTKEYKAMAKWSELRAKGQFLQDVDQVSFEKEVGIPYSRALEIEEELRSSED